MPSPAELAWLIPVLPLIGAAIVGLGLISFNRTVNRLRKPVALLLISCVGAAAVLSYAVLAQQLAGAGIVERVIALDVRPPIGYLMEVGRLLVATEADAWMGGQLGGQAGCARLLGANHHEIDAHTVSLVGLRLVVGVVAVRLGAIDDNFQRLDADVR